MGHEWASFNHRRAAGMDDERGQADGVYDTLSLVPEMFESNRA